MNAPLSHNKLQVRYRVLQLGETATVWVAGGTSGNTVPERWQAWRSMTRIQWYPNWMEGELLERALREELRRSHPSAKEVAVDRITVIRARVVLQER